MHENSLQSISVAQLWVMWHSGHSTLGLGASTLNLDNSGLGLVDIGLGLESASLSLVTMVGSAWGLGQKAWFNSVQASERHKGCY